MIPSVDLTSNPRGWKPSGWKPIPACAASGDGQGFTVGGNRWEEKPYVTIDFLLLLLPFSILTGNIPTLAQRTKVTTKDPLRITTHARLAFVTPLTIPTREPLSKGIVPKSHLPKESPPLPRSESPFEDSADFEAVGSTRNARELRFGEVPAGFGPFGSCLAALARRMGG